MNMDWNRPIPNPATLRQLVAEYLGRPAAAVLGVDSRFAAAHYQDGRDLRTPMAAAGGNPLPAERLNEPLCPGPVRCPDPFAARLDQDCRVCGGRDPLPF